MFWRVMAIFRVQFYFDPQKKLYWTHATKSSLTPTLQMSYVVFSRPRGNVSGD